MDNSSSPNPIKPWNTRVILNKAEKINIAREILSLGSGMRFVRFVCENNLIEMCYVGGIYKLALFFLGMIDHLCKENNCPLEPRFDEYRSSILDETVVSRRIADLIFTPIEFLKATEDLNRHAIPELARFNIFMTREDISPKG